MEVPKCKSCYTKALKRYQTTKLSTNTVLNKRDIREYGTEDYSVELWSSSQRVRFKPGNHLGTKLIPVPIRVHHVDWPYLLSLLVNRSLCKDRYVQTDVEALKECLSPSRPFFIRGLARGIAIFGTC